MQPDLNKNLILLTIAGSRAYGIHTESSDVDLKGLAFADKPVYFGTIQNWEQSELKDFSGLAAFTQEEQEVIKHTKTEGVIYEVRKFIRLASDCNPNILDVLFCRPEEIRGISKFGERLLENRELFISAKAKHTYSGYAISQLKRINSHRKWLLDPPSHQPTREEYKLPEKTLLPKDQLAAIQAMIKKQMDRWEFDFGHLNDAEIIHIQIQISEYLENICGALGYSDNDTLRWEAAAKHIGIDDNVIYLLQKEREYNVAATNWQQYQNWKKNRNPDRALLEEKYGFDAKHAGHLVRLLRMGKEILLTGKVHVWRGPGGGDDAEYILDIRHGKYSFDEVMDVVNKETADLDDIYKNRKYVVPKQSPEKEIEELCIQMIEEFLY